MQFVAGNLIFETEEGALHGLARRDRHFTKQAEAVKLLGVSSTSKVAHCVIGLSRVKRSYSDERKAFPQSRQHIRMGS
jgi:hypothetical protein